MRTIRYILLIFITAFIVIQFVSCGKKAPTESEYQKSRPGLWNKDLDYFSSQLKTKEYGFSSQISVQYFDSTINYLKNSVEALQDFEIYFKLQELIAKFKVAHLSTAPPSSQKFHFLPFYSYVFQDGVYVIMTDQEHLNLLGKKLTAIGGKSVAEVEAKIKNIISYENEYWLKHKLPAAFCCAEILKYYGFTDDPLRVECEIEGIGRITLNTTEKTAGNFLYGMIPALDDNNLPLYLQKPDDYYWYNYLSTEKTMYIKYNVCANSSDLSFSSFTNNVAGYISTHQVDKIIVDLRNNPGGSSSVINPLMSYLSGSKFDTAGKLFVAFDRGTFSSGLLNSISLKANTNCITAGEPTGGKPNSYGEVSTFSLPNSGIRITYCNAFFNFSPGDPDALHPDYEIPLTSQDYFSGKDPVLEFILNYK